MGNDSRKESPLATDFVHRKRFRVCAAISRLLFVPGKEEGILAYDFFHGFHLGIGKNFVGSCFALLSDHFPGNNIEDRFQALEQHFFAWCHTAKQIPTITRLTKDTIQWGSRQDFPSGNWFKASVTTTFCRYLEHVLTTQNWQHEPMLEKAGEAVTAMNFCLSSLYASDVFVEPPARAIDIAEHGLKFLRRLQWLAKDAIKCGQALWLLTPKCHIIHHLLLEDMLIPALRGISPCNPLSFSVQQDEDFIGKASRLSRKVDPRTCSKRCIERYLCSAYAEYVKIKFIVLPVS